MISKLIFRVMISCVGVVGEEEEGLLPTRRGGGRSPDTTVERFRGNLAE